ncbi:MAG TPA: hypothetical protein PLN93_06615 [Vicinamibacterales bacterium]|nr:hypothetical protein [Vicinamibacterales bacterium]
MIWIALCLAACAGIESDIIRLGPKPPVERFPARPYVAPPTPEEKAAAALAAEAMRAARAERRAAISNLLASVGIVEKPDADAKEIAATAAKITAVAEVLKKEAQISPVK